jgi:Zinc carboxypeptidase
MHSRKLLIPGILLCLLVSGFSAITFETRGPDSRYWDYDEILSQLDSWAAEYPDIFHREVIGQTGVNNEDIWAVKVSDNADTHEAERRVMFNAAIHGNEANGPGAIMHLLDRILTGYDSGVPYYTNMVNNLEMWFVPVLNIDGYRIVFAGNTYWNSWRKNKRDNNNDGQYTYPIDGVDCNRNWDYLWGSYNHTNPSDSRYKGPYVFSEPCVVAMRNLIQRENPTILMDFHSPDTPDIGNKIWWPWYDQQQGYGVDREVFEPFSQALGNRCLNEHGTQYVNGLGPCFNELPKEQCWAYSKLGICALLMEISYQYWHTGAIVDTIAARTGRGNLYVLEKALAGPGLTGRVTNELTGAPIVAEIKVHQMHDSQVGPRLSEQFYGHYSRMLNGGSYTVTVEARDYDPITTSVYVSYSGWTTRDFELMPEDWQSVDTDQIVDESLLWTDGMMSGPRSIHFRLLEPSQVRLEIFDVSGRRVEELVNDELSAGVRSIAIPNQLGSGTYWARLSNSDWELKRKFVVVQ